MNIKEKVIKLIIDYNKKQNLKEITYDIGEIIEKDNKYICLVNQEKLNKWYNYHKKNDHYFHLFLNGINTKITEIEDKPIYYIFNNIDFSFPLQFSSNFKPYIIFNNCIFKRNIDIICSDGELYFHKNNYVSKDDKLFQGNRINKITFNHDSFLYINPKNVEISINSNEVNLIDTKIDINLNDYSYFSINAKKLLVKDSFLRMNNLKLDVNDIDWNNTPIISMNIIINNSSYNTIECIYTNKLLYNNALIKEDNVLDNNIIIFDNARIDINNELINELIGKLKLKRKILHILKQLNKECKSIKEQILIDKEQELNQKKILELKKDSI